MARVLKLLLLVPIAVVIVAFAIANRQMVTISFDPFSEPDVSGAFLSAPLFLVLFLALIVGTFIGGVATWFTQGRNRRRARAAEDEAERWREEVRRVRDQQQIAPVGRDLVRSDYA